MQFVHLFVGLDDATRPCCRRPKLSGSRQERAARHKPITGPVVAGNAHGYPVLHDRRTAANRWPLPMATIQCKTVACRAVWSR
jgi:hypothetical protein